MKLNRIDDDILREAVASQPDRVFDTHDVVFWITRNAPRRYAADLHSACDEEGDPFVRLHTAIGRKLAQLPGVCQKQGRKRTSLNVRGEQSSCEVWTRTG